MFSILINKARSSPKRLFLVDGLGAVLSAFLLGVVLVRLESFFGIPRTTLYFLAFLPCLFAVFDLYSYQNNGDNTSRFLRGIATANLLYCCLSIGLAFYHVNEITVFGWIYIIIEVVIIIILSVVEFKVARLLSLKDYHNG